MRGGPFVPFHVPFRTGTEAAAVAAALDRSHIGGNGPTAAACELRLAEKVGVPRVLLTPSCTHALELAALLSGVGPGDEVLVPSFTFVATANAFVLRGARVVFCEVEPNTLTIDLEDAARRITEKTRVIVPVDYGGVPVPPHKLADFATSHGLDVVEDAAQAFDCRWDDRSLGTLGRFGAFSFHESKNVHCGLGGALTITDPDDIERAEFAWHRGTDRVRMERGLAQKYTWVAPGSSYYITEIQAAFLGEQLRATNRIRRKRLPLWRAYHEGLAELEAAEKLRRPQLPKRADHTGHVYWVLARTPEEARALMGYLGERNILAVRHYVALHASPMGSELGWTPDDLPLTADLAERVVRLPLHTSMDMATVERVINAVHDFFGEP